MDPVDGSVESYFHVSSAPSIDEPLSCPGHEAAVESIQTVQLKTPGLISPFEHSLGDGAVSERALGNGLPLQIIQYAR